MTVIGANKIPSSSVRNTLNIYDLQTGPVSLDKPEQLQEFGHPSEIQGSKDSLLKSQREGNTASLQAEQAPQPVNQEASTPAEIEQK